MKLIFIRHGRTDWNSENRLQGWLDSGLREENRALVNELKLPKSSQIKLFSSHLGRAKETARMIASLYGYQLQLDTRLKERGFGRLQGQVVDKCVHLSKEWNCYHHRYTTPLSGHCFEEEPESLFRQRVMSFLQERQAEKSPVTVIVSHGEWIRACINLLKQQPSWVYGQGIPENLTPTTIEWDGVLSH